MCVRWYMKNWVWRMKQSEVKLLSPVRLSATPWTIAHQAPPSMGFSRQEYWSRLPFPSALVYEERFKEVNTKYVEVLAFQISCMKMEIHLQITWLINLAKIGIVLLTCSNWKIKGTKEALNLGRHISRHHQKRWKKRNVPKIVILPAYGRIPHSKFLPHLLLAQIITDCFKLLTLCIHCFM